MKVRFNKTTWRAASGIVASFLLVVSFQNCGKAGFDADLDNSLDLSSSDAALTTKYGTSTAAKVQNVPFAFESTFDTITYNSCAETHLRNNPAFASLKMGAYSSGGIKIKDDFYTYADQNFKPIYPETALSENQYKEYLADSPANAGAVPTVAVRVKNSLTDVYTANSNVTLWQDVIPLVGNLTDPLVLDSYAKKGVTANYFPFSPEQRVMEASMSFNSDEALADTYRGIFQGSGILALTYMPQNAEAIYKVRSATTTYPVKSAYGKGYTLTFAQPSGVSTNPFHILGAVMETDLANPGVGARNWNCSRVYAVVRAQDAATLCPQHTYADLANPTIRSELNIARRTLRADEWDVNVSYRCVVPKKGVSCYKEENITPLVQYDTTKECFRPTNTNYLGGTTPSARCLHYVTICTRD